MIRIARPILFYDYSPRVSPGRVCLGCLGVEANVFILVSGVHSQAVGALLGNIQEAPGGSLLADVQEARAGHRVPGTHPKAAVDVGSRGGGWVLGKIYIWRKI